MYKFPKIVITGMGIINPIGNSIDEFWTSLKNGVSGARRISKFDASSFKSQIAAEVKNFDPLLYMDSKDVKAMDQYSQYAVAAAVQAIDLSGITKSSFDPFRVGVIIGSGIGGLNTLQSEISAYAVNPSKPRHSPHMITKMISNISSGIIAMRYDFRGPNYGTVSACASSNHAIADAINLLRLGKADAIIVGGSESTINETSIGGFSNMRALSERNDSPETASRPFDKDRDGFVIGEGSGIMVIETLEHAQKRNARIYAELAGYGMSADAFHFTLPHPEGRSVEYAMKMALEDAGLTPVEVDYINLHGTSTPAGDPPELMAVQRLFSSNLKNLHVSATKSMTGHLLGAAGASEAITSVLAMYNSLIPPTINTQNVDPKIDVQVDLTLTKAAPKTLRAVLSNTFGFGGQNACIAFKAFHQ